MQASTRAPGFDEVVPHAPMSREARASRVNWLRRVLAE
jgi:hypothetical protein